jgi:hypothetical protein
VKCAGEPRLDDGKFGQMAFLGTVKSPKSRRQTVALGKTIPRAL